MENIIIDKVEDNAIINGENEDEKTNLLNLEKPVILKEGYAIARKKSTEVQNLVKEIDVNNVGTILNFGAKPAEDLSKISDDILSTTKKVENIEATKIIKNLTKLIEKVDISDFEKAPKKEGGWLSKVFNFGKNVLEKYENMNKEIEVITNELLNYKVSIEKDQNDLKKLYDIVSKSSVELNDYIYAIEIAEEEIKGKLFDITKTVNVDENEKNREIAKTQALLDMVSQKRYDLETVKTVSLQTLPMIEMMAQNNFGLARKLHSSLITTLPVFKNAIILAVQTKRQMLLKNTFTTLDKATEELITRNATNIVKASTEITKIANISAISVESLKKNFEIVTKGIKETKELQEKARKEREQNIKELNKLNDEMEKNKVIKM